jgi:hypothetical protein
MDNSVLDIFDNEFFMIKATGKITRSKKVMSEGNMTVDEVEIEGAEIYPRVVKADGRIGKIIFSKN